KSNNVWPEFVRISFAIGLISAFVSTADTSLLLTSTLLQNEVKRNAKEHEKNLSDKFTNYSVIVITVVAISVSLLLTDLANSFTGVLGMLAVLGLTTIAAFLGRGNSVICIFSFTIGGILSILQTYIFPQYNTGYYLLLPLLPGLLCFLVKSPKHERTT
ncbi:MAG: hypothetical protein ACKVQV_08685, partial [Bacteroidia bacterium]